MNMEELQLLWFFLLGVLLVGYAVLDGFDLGVGVIHPFVRGDHDRRIVINSIGPLWDGNEVWLVTFGGALFAAFPPVYATVLSGFYLPIMLLLFALIGRAVSIEFRSKVASPFWRTYWDHSFAFSSFVTLLVFGIAGGNVLRGLPIGADGELEASLIDVFNPYAVAVGLLNVAAATMHGSIFLYLKTEGDLQRRVHRWMWHTFGVFLVAYLMVTIMTLVMVPEAIRNFRDYPIAWVVVALNVLAVGNIPRAIFIGRPGYAFASSCAVIVALVSLFAIALFPALAPSSIDPAHSLTIFNASSSEATLRLMRNIAFIGMPFVLTYTGIIYWVFRGKTKLDQFSY